MTLENKYFSIHLLIAGIAHWLAQRQEDHYNLPDLARWAFNYLHLQQIKRKEIPFTTHNEVLRYLTNPLLDLFEQDDIPPNLVAYSILDNFPVETEFDLADGIREYMQEYALDRVSDIRGLVEISENAAAKDIKVILSNQYQLAGLTNFQRREIEEKYVEWRTFFRVEHNIVNPAADGLLFDPIWLNILEGGFYEKAHKRHSRIVSHDDNNNPVYLISTHCGLLYRNSSGDFQPITASPAFNSHDHIEMRPVSEGDYVLKQTHQRRILIPGIPEMYLYNMLKTHPSVKSVRIYPGVDRYDLRVEFQDQTHAIDIKDHRRPYALEKLLSGKMALPLVDEHEVDELGYDVFLYLIPSARVQKYDDGLKKLKRVERQHKNLFIMTVEQYVEELKHV